MSEIDTEKVIVQLLDDEPADSSAFKSHQDISDAIYDMISCEKKGRIVGLFGSWGSGKSTVINLLSKKFQQYNDNSPKIPIALFPFDAWMHGTDPLRRSFIEKLLDFYHPDFLNKEDAKYVRVLDEITRRKEDQKVTETPRIKPSGVLLLVLYVLTTSVAGYIFDKVLQPSDGWTWLLPIFLLIWPALLLFCERTRNLTSLVFNEVEKEVTQTVIRTPDPTAIEFQEYFDTIIRDAQKKAHKLIIVLDNLDRITDEEEAGRMLSTIRSFFTNKSSDNIWVIVPLDPSALKRIYKGDGNIADSYIEKTFCIKYHLAFPIITDNQKYFLEKIEAAFPGMLSDDDKEAVFQIYERQEYGAQRNTPRKIKIFINDLGSLYRIWNKEIPICTLAMYCLKRPQIERQGLQAFLAKSQGSFEGISYRDLILVNNENWDRDFAAIYFGVDKDKALHVLAGDDLQKGLEDGKDDDKFLSIAKIHAFKNILQEEMHNRILSITESGSRLANAAYSLEFLEQNTSDDISFVWPLLASHTQRLERWDEFSEKTSKGLALFIKKCPDEKIDSVLKSLFKALITLLPEHLQNQATTIKYWVEALSEIQSVAQNKGFESAILGCAAVEDTSLKTDFLVKALSYAASKNLKSLSAYFGKVFGIASMDKHLAGLISNPKDLSEMQSVTNYINGTCVRNEYKAVVDALSKIISFQDNSNDVLRALEILSDLGDPRAFASNYAREKLKECCEHGYVYGHLLFAQQNKNSKLAGTCLAITVEHHLQTISSNFGGNQAFVNGYNMRENMLKGTADLVDEVLAESLNQIQFVARLEDVIAAIFPYKQYRPFAAKLLAKAISEENFINDIDIDHVIDNFSIYSDLLKQVGLDAKTGFVQRLCSRNEFVSKITEGKFSGEPLELYVLLLNIEGKMPPSIKEYIKTSIEGMSTDEWRDALSKWIQDGKNPKMECFSILVSQDEPLHFSAGANEALVDNLEKVADLSVDENNALGLIAKIPDYLSEREQKLFTEKLRAKVQFFAEKDALSKVDLLIKTFGHYLTKHQALNGHAEDWLNWILLPAVVKKLPNTLKWMHNEGEKISLLLSVAQKEQLKERLIENISSAKEENDHNLAIGIAKKFGLDIEQNKTEENREADEEVDNIKSA